MHKSDGGGGLIFQMAGASLLVGAMWYLLTGAVWQFVPIGAAVYMTFQFGKALHAR